MLRLTPFACALLLAACGGNVVVDQPSTGGAGGAATVTIPTGSTTTIITTTPTTTTIPTTTTTSTTPTTSSTTVTTTTTTNLPCGGGVVSSDPACQSCVEEVCCAELAACWPGSPCDKLITCLDSCGQELNCHSNCFDIYSDGYPALQNLGTCAQITCGEDQLLCLTPVCDAGVEAVGPFCGDCIAQGCCDEVVACVNDGSCIDCFADPNNPACMSNAVFDATITCIQDWCGSLCF